MADRVSERTPSVLLVGERPRRALVLAAGFFAATAVTRAVVLPNAHDPAILYDVVTAALEGFRFESVYAPAGLGPVTIAGLAAIHAYLDGGYVPGLLLAGAPSYGFYVFNGPGAAPLWAAQFVALEVVTYGTVGFLLGLGLRRSGVTASIVTRYERVRQRL